MSVLRHVLDLYEIPYPEVDYLCTYKTALKTWSGLDNYKLDTVCKFLKYDFELVGLVHQNEGTISVFGRSPSWRNNGEIAYLPDRGRWYDIQTIAEALAYAQVIFPAFDLDLARKMADSMDLDPAAQVSTLSKGLEARLNLILCLARRVRLVLLDEPFSGIDLVYRDKIIQNIIDSMLDLPKTIIICTHEIHEAESIFDHVIFLDQGRQVLAGNAEQLRAEKGSIESVYRGLFQ